MIAPTPAGPWKEGRVGGVTLCYISPNAVDLADIAKRHAAVGIRATVACVAVDPFLRTLAQRNWDLALHADAPALSALAAAMAEIDKRAVRGSIGSAALPAAGLYRVDPRAVGTIPAPRPDLSRPLPAMIPPADPGALPAAIESVVSRGHWAIWLCDAAYMAALTPAGHARLLGYLGDHHARIWSAPIRDIATWTPPA